MGGGDGEGVWEKGRTGRRLRRARSPWLGVWLVYGRFVQVFVRAFSRCDCCSCAEESALCKCSLNVGNTKFTPTVRNAKTSQNTWLSEFSGTNIYNRCW